MPRGIRKTLDEAHARVKIYFDGTHEVKVMHDGEVLQVFTRMGHEEIAGRVIPDGEWELWRPQGEDAKARYYQCIAEFYETVIFNLL